MKTFFTALLMLFWTISFGQTDFSDSIKIVKTTDKYTGEKTFSTGPVISYSLQKIYPNGASQIYSLKLQAFGNSAVIDGKGAFIMFDDGEVYSEKEAVIKVNAGSSLDNFIYSTVLAVDDKLLSLLKKHYIVSFKLYIYDNNLDCGQSIDEFKKLGFTDNDINQILKDRSYTDLASFNKVRQSKLKNFPLWVEALIQTNQ